MSNVLTIGLRYVDPETGHWFILDAVKDKTVCVTDQWGNAREVGRWSWEREMQPVDPNLFAGQR